MNGLFIQSDLHVLPTVLLHPVILALEILISQSPICVETRASRNVIYIMNFNNLRRKLYDGSKSMSMLEFRIMSVCHLQHKQVCDLVQIHFVFVFVEGVRKQT